MAFSGPIEDRGLIRELMDSYDDTVFRRDVDAWLEHWTEDGIWTIAGIEIRGKPALRAEWENRWQDLKRMSFQTRIGAMEVDGERAVLRCYCHETLLLKQGGLRRLVGRYDDELRREQGQWRFVTRGYRLHLDEGAGPLLPLKAG
ncbi:YybH family protein [Solimonas terrae]|uniref:Nuclear transport factor 2 family protein n=1 Tax=Solimonas terrae TaxID=1396819 RepID=A0A6M2BNL6_9GAMM|nr:nuclear transport factor 2 family protein [Solimonas terrae]NGY03964.1 nuclear transport factor 2 family protein [Solimonas terrae]